MEIGLNVKEIPYGDLAEELLPLATEKRLETDGIAGTVLRGLSKLPGGTAKKVLDTMPKETKDEIVIQLLNKNKEKIIYAATQYAESQGLGIVLRDLSVVS